MNLLFYNTSICKEKENRKNLKRIQSEIFFSFNVFLNCLNLNLLVASLHPFKINTHVCHSEAQKKKVYKSKLNFSVFLSHCFVKFLI